MEETESLEAFLSRENPEVVIYENSLGITDIAVRDGIHLKIVRFNTTTGIATVLSTQGPETPPGFLPFPPRKP